MRTPRRETGGRRRAAPPIASHGGELWYNTGLRVCDAKCARQAGRKSRKTLEERKSEWRTGSLRPRRQGFRRTIRRLSSPALRVSARAPKVKDAVERGKAGGEFSADAQQGVLSVFGGSAQKACCANYGDMSHGGIAKEGTRRLIPYGRCSPSGGRRGCRRRSARRSPLRRTGRSRSQPVRTGPWRRGCSVCG